VSAPATYKPEVLNAFEVGTKNTFLGGHFRANLSAFYYDYKGLQISRLINRTVFNDNVDAKIYGVEGEFVMAPTRALQFNVTASYLHTSVGSLQLIDPRDPSGGRSDAVIIKDLAGGANCVVAPTAAGSGALANAFVNAVNTGLGLKGTVPIPGTNTTGAYSLCSSLAGAASNPSSALSAMLGQGPGPLPIQLDPNVATPKLLDGIAVNVTGNQLPNSPKFKVAMGAQYTADLGSNGMNAVLRIDYALTGTAYSRLFNRAIDRIPSYDVVNAQLQLNGADDRWFARLFVQNLFDNNAITGEFVADASSGLYTNIFTLEPRRFGLALGVKY
jgi:outer membrane receptor protein involved in Fe transport